MQKQTIPDAGLRHDLQEVLLEDLFSLLPLAVRLPNQLFLRNNDETGMILFKILNVAIDDF